MSGLSAPVYEMVSMGLRYWLFFLAVVIVWRAVRLMQKESRLYKKTMRQLPDAGLVGELVDLETGESHPLPREGMIGSGHASDIRLPGIRRRALEMAFRAGHGLKLIPSHHKHSLRLDDELIDASGDYALHGSVLDLGQTAYRFGLFEGLDVPERHSLPYSPEYENPEDAWARQMVMESPPPMPPGEDGYGMALPVWAQEVQPELPEEGLYTEESLLPPSRNWEGQDGN